MSSALQNIVLLVTQSEGNTDCISEPGRARDIVSSFENSTVNEECRENLKSYSTVNAHRTR
jgi:hypothetical protein